jgi:hypothetical protein
LTRVPPTSTTRTFTDVLLYFVADGDSRAASSGFGAAFGEAATSVWWMHSC